MSYSNLCVYMAVHILRKYSLHLLRMSDIGVRDLRAQLAAVVRRAGSGERIVVTVDGKPVAQVGPIEGDSLAISLPELVVRHLVIAPRRRGDFVLPEPLPLYSGVRVERTISEIRR